MFLTTTSMIKKIIVNNTISGILIKKEFTLNDGIEFVNSKDDEFQIGLMKRKKGYKVTPHYHEKISRKIKMTSEALFVKKGSVECTLFDKNDKQNGKTFIIKKGDILVIFDSAHKFNFLEDSEIIEIKQGPFIDSKIIL